MWSADLHRRRFLTICGTGATVLLAGCGDTNRGEVEENIEASQDHIESAESLMADNGGHVNDNEWGTCLTTVDEADSELSEAGGLLNDGRELAEEDGLNDHVEAIDQVLEYVDHLAKMNAEFESLCEAGQNGDEDEVQQRWERIQDLDDQRGDIREEASDAINNL